MNTAHAYVVASTVAMRNRENINRWRCKVRDKAPGYPDLRTLEQKLAWSKIDLRFKGLRVALRSAANPGTTPDAC